MPVDPVPDRTWEMLTDPYRFIGRRCDALRANAFRTRLMLQPAICMRGAEAARLFSDPQLMTRHGAAPESIKSTLLGYGGIQSFDGEEHWRRKQLFLSLLTADRAERLNALVRQNWEAAARRWTSWEEVRLYDELLHLLCRGVCEWAGVPLCESELPRRTAELSLLFDHSGWLGLKHLASRAARRDLESWGAELIRAIRAGRLPADEQSALAALAHYRDSRGELLTEPVAAVELLNLLRPTLAVGMYLTFVALSLYEFPSQCESLGGSDEDVEPFVLEVKRYYPFFPPAVALVREDFTALGGHFQHGQRVYLDLYGTNHDARAWDHPEEFRPERFRDRGVDSYSYIPQGAGQAAIHHRCPGEEATTELMKSFTRFLTRQLDYRVRRHDYRIDFHRLPAKPLHPLILERVALRESAL